MIRIFNLNGILKNKSLKSRELFVKWRLALNLPETCCIDNIAFKGLKKKKPCNNNNMLRMALEPNRALMSLLTYRLYCLLRFSNIYYEL